MTHVDYNLAIRSHVQVGTVHRPWSRTFEVDAFTVVTAPVTRALEFVFGWLPIGRTTQVRAAGKDYKKPIRCSVNPNAVLLKPFLVDSEGVVGWIPNLENSSRLKKHTRHEESKERDEPCRKKSSYAAPNKPPPTAVDNGISRSDR